MAGWNYRLIKTFHYHEGYQYTEDDWMEPCYEEALDYHEVHYDDDDLPYCWTKDPVTAHGDTVDEVRWCLKQMMRTTHKPILTEIELDGVPTLVEVLDD